MEINKKSKNTAQGRNKPELVTELKHNDVLLGRGAGSINYVGNVLFREIVKERRDEYLATARRQAKDSIARQIVNVVLERNGRFLRKISSTEEKAIYGIAEDSNAYLIAEDDKVLEKVKQSLRDKEYNPDDKKLYRKHSSSCTGDGAEKGGAAHTNASVEQNSTYSPSSKAGQTNNLNKRDPNEAGDSIISSVRDLSGQYQGSLPQHIRDMSTQAAGHQNLGTMAWASQDQLQQLILSQSQAELMLQSRLNNILRQEHEAQLMTAQQNSLSLAQNNSLNIAAPSTSLTYQPSLLFPETGTDLGNNLLLQELLMRRNLPSIFSTPMSGSPSEALNSMNYHNQNDASSSMRLNHTHVLPDYTESQRVETGLLGIQREDRGLMLSDKASGRKDDEDQKN